MALCGAVVGQVGLARPGEKRAIGAFVVVIYGRWATVAVGVGRVGFRGCGRSSDATIHRSRAVELGVQRTQQLPGVSSGTFKEVIEFLTPDVIVVGGSAVVNGLFAGDVLGALDRPV